MNNRNIVLSFPCHIKKYIYHDEIEVQATYSLKRLLRVFLYKNNRPANKYYS